MLVNRERRADKKKQISQVRGAKQEVPERDLPLWQCAVNDATATAAVADPTARGAHGGGGGEDVPQSGEDDVAKFLGSVCAGLSEVFLTALRGAGVTSADTLGLFAGDETFSWIRSMDSKHRLCISASSLRH